MITVSCEISVYTIDFKPSFTKINDGKSIWLLETSSFDESYSLFCFYWTK